MEYRRIGSSGLRVSEVAVGSWLTFGSRVEQEDTSALVRAALDAGVTLFDTADVYALGRAEEMLGAALRDVPRKDVVLASKVYFPTGDGPNDRGLSRKHVFETVHASLRRLGTDYVDLFQCHRYDDETPVEETVRAFDDLIRQGKILHWGVSLWNAAQLDEAMDVALALGAHPPISNQPPYNLVNRGIEAEVVPACERHGLGLLCYSPLAQGVLTGKYSGGRKPGDSRAADPKRNQFIGRWMEPDILRRVDAMAGIAKRAGMTPARLALAWLLTRPRVASVLVGVTKMEQLAENVAASGSPLPDDVVAELEQLFPAGS